MKLFREGELANPEAGFESGMREFTPEQTAQLERYYELLLDWNSRINLTAITEHDAVWQRHFRDSVMPGEYLTLPEEIPSDGDVGTRLLDMGTGAGFPGIPLKICYPGLQVTLVDYLQKRIGFLEAVIHELGLTGITAIHGRAEELAAPGAPLRESFDLVTSRAVARLSTLSEYCVPFLKVGGQFIAYKSPDCTEELTDAKQAIFLLGGRLDRVETFELPAVGDEPPQGRTLIFIKKQQSTAKTYPRRAGLPSKKPL